MDGLNLANYDLLVVRLHSFKFLDFFEAILSLLNLGVAPRGSVTTTYSRLILGDVGCKLLTACLNIGMSNELKLHTIYFVISGQIKPLLRRDK